MHTPHLLIDSIDLDSAATRAMQDAIKLLNEKLVYLNDGSRRLHGLYDKSMAKAKNLQDKLNTCEKHNLETTSLNQVFERKIEGMYHKSMNDLLQILNYE